jgi:hypothetical protein
VRWITCQLAGSWLPAGALVRGIDIAAPETYLAAEQDGGLDDLPTNHSPKFLPRCSPLCGPVPSLWS